MTKNPSRQAVGIFRRGWVPAGLVFVLAAALLAAGLVSQPSQVANAAAAPVTQCNNETASNVGGQGIACTVTIHNYVTGTGDIVATAPSTVTVTRCVGAAGPIGSGAGTCTTTTTTSAEPIMQVQQCNGSGNGGGGVVICTVTITNHFSSSPAVPATPATVYQCVGSVITGTGAPGICTPDNTPGITSVTAATVGQCNGSGNGGTSVGFVCTVTAGSTTTTALPVHIDQCNGSGNGGGSLVTCQATVSNQVVTAPASPSPTGSATPSATGSPTVTPTGTRTSTPIVASPTPAPGTPGAPGVTTTPGASPTPTAPAVVTTSTPGPPATGNADSAGGGPAQALPWLVGAIAVLTVLGFVLSGQLTVSRRRIR